MLINDRSHLRGLDSYAKFVKMGWKDLSMRLTVP